MLWNMVSEILASPCKERVLRALNGEEVDQRSLARLCRLERSNARRTIKVLVAWGLIECLTPSRPRARIYQLTKEGKEILKQVDKKRGRIPHA